MIPVPKYEIGQQVFIADTHENSTPLPCPDCKDTTTWTVTTGAGESFTVPCQRCAGGYRNVDLPSLYQRIWTPFVRSLTIGQVRIETPVARHGWNEEPVNYMCVETGVGSGSIYRESQLFATESEAQAQAQFDATKKTADFAAKPEPSARREIATLKLTDAIGDDARKTVWGVSYHAGQLREKVEGWLEKDGDFGADSNQRELIHDALRDLEWHDSPERNPLYALVLAARAIEGNAELAKALEPFVFVKPFVRELV